MNANQINAQTEPILQYDASAFAKRMEEYGWKPIKAAAEADVSITTVHAILKGETNIRLTSLEALAKALNLSANDVFPAAEQQAA